MATKLNDLETIWQNQINQTCRRVFGNQFGLYLNQRVIIARKVRGRADRIAKKLYQNECVSDYCCNNGDPKQHVKIPFQSRLIPCT